MGILLVKELLSPQISCKTVDEEELKEIQKEAGRIKAFISPRCGE